MALILADVSGAPGAGRVYAVMRSSALHGLFQHPDGEACRESR
jgi:hypothetical protein